MFNKKILLSVALSGILSFSSYALNSDPAGTESSASNIFHSQKSPIIHRINFYVSNYLPKWNSNTSVKNFSDRVDNKASEWNKLTDEFDQKNQIHALSTGSYALSLISCFKIWDSEKATLRGGVSYKFKSIWDTFNLWTNAVEHGTSLNCRALSAYALLKLENEHIKCGYGFCTAANGEPHNFVVYKINNEWRVCDLLNAISIWPIPENTARNVFGFSGKDLLGMNLNTYLNIFADKNKPILVLCDYARNRSWLGANKEGIEKTCIQELRNIEPSKLGLHSRCSYIDLERWTRLADKGGDNL